MRNQHWFDRMVKAIFEMLVIYLLPESQQTLRRTSSRVAIKSGPPNLLPRRAFSFLHGPCVDLSMLRRNIPAAF